MLCYPAFEIVLRWLLAGPYDARHPTDLLDVEATDGIVFVERGQFDIAGRLSRQLFDHDLAVCGLDHDPVAAPDTPPS